MCPYLWVTLERDFRALGLLEYLRLGGYPGLELSVQALLVTRSSA